MESIFWLPEISKHDIGLVGGKGANLGELFNRGIPVPLAFCITSPVYKQHILENSAIRQGIERGLEVIDYADIVKLHDQARYIRRLVSEVELASPLEAEIVEAYMRLKTWWVRP